MMVLVLLKVVEMLLLLKDALLDAVDGAVARWQQGCSPKTTVQSLWLVVKVRARRRHSAKVRWNKATWRLHRKMGVMYHGCCFGHSWHRHWGGRSAATPTPPGPTVATGFPAPLASPP